MKPCLPTMRRAMAKQHNSFWFNPRFGCMSKQRINNVIWKAQADIAQFGLMRAAHWFGARYKDVRHV